MEQKEIKYLKIAELIKLKILNHIYKPHDLLPSENSLCEEYSVSRMTIRKSIERLVNEGYLYSSPGKGTFVKDYLSNKFEIDFDIDNVLIHGYTQTKLIDAKIISPTIDLVYHLNIAPKEKIVCMRWILYQGETPIALDEKYIPYFPGMSIEEDSFSYANMIDIVSNDNFIYGFSEDIIITGVSVDEQILKYMLEIPQSAFMTLFEQKLFDIDHIPVGYGKLYVRSDQCKIIGYSKL